MTRRYVTKADLELIDRISAGEPVRGAARIVREFRRKLELQLGLPFPAERTQTPEALPARPSGRDQAAKEHLS